MSEHKPSGHEDDDGGNRRGALLALIVVVVLIIGGWMLTNILHGVGSIQDCAMAGRSNCAPVQAPPRQ